MNVYELMLWVSVVFLVGCVIEFFYSVYHHIKLNSKLENIANKAYDIKIIRK